MPRKLYRSETDKILFGVCGGLAQYFNIDSSLMRLIFVIISIWGGLGVLLYILLIFVMPVEPADITQEKINSAKKNKTLSARNSAVAISREQLFGLIVLIVGLLLLVQNFSSSFHLGRLWPLLLIVVGIYVVSKALKKG